MELDKFLCYSVSWEPVIHIGVFKLYIYAFTLIEPPNIRKTYEKCCLMLKAPLLKILVGFNTGCFSTDHDLWHKYR